jgi:hypothetical protein
MGAVRRRSTRAEGVHDEQLTARVLEGIRRAPERFPEAELAAIGAIADQTCLDYVAVIRDLSINCW